MKTTVTTTAFGLLIAATTSAQFPRSYAISPPQPGAYLSYSSLDLGGDTTLTVFRRLYGFLDSMRYEMLWTDVDQMSFQSVAMRLPGSGIMGPVERFDGGFLSSGQVSDDPYLLKFSATGSLEWAQVLSNTLVSGGFITRLYPRDNDFTAYSWSPTLVTDRIDRIDGDASGTSFVGVGTQAAVDVRLWAGVALDDPHVHLLSGATAAEPDSINALLMRMDESGCTWMRRYDLGSSSTEGLQKVRRLADGDLLLCGYVNNALPDYDGILMKVDTAGTVIWCGRYTHASGGLNFFDSHEMPDGSILIAARNALLQGVLLRVDANGQPIWTKVVEEGQLGWFHGSDGLLKMDGNVKRELDADGNGCDLVETTNAVMNVVVPVITPVAVTNTPFTISTTPTTILPRIPTLGWAVDCVTTAIDEPRTPAEIRAYPVPTSSSILVTDGPDPIPRDEPIIMYDAGGSVVFEAPYGTGIDVSAMPAGSYVIHLPKRSSYLKVIRDRTR